VKGENRRVHRSGRFIKLPFPQKCKTLFNIKRMIVHVKVYSKIRLNKTFVEVRVVVEFVCLSSVFVDTNSKPSTRLTNIWCIALWCAAGEFINSRSVKCEGSVFRVK